MDRNYSDWKRLRVRRLAIAIICLVGALGLYVGAYMFLLRGRPWLGYGMAAALGIAATFWLVYGVITIRLVFSKEMKVYGEMLELDELRKTRLIHDRDFLKRFP